MNNPYKIVSDFEEVVADYAGSRYAVATESCTAAIFLSLQVYNVKGLEISIPSRTYPGVPCSIIQSGGKVNFAYENWEGVYRLKPTNIIDGALRFRRGMYHKGTLHCLSFHVRKLIPIGRGGMILTDNHEAYEWLKLARFDGREPVPLREQKEFTVIGWNMYMPPADAARGLQLFQALGDKELPDLRVEDQKYADLSKFPIYQQ